MLVDLNIKLLRTDNEGAHYYYHLELDDYDSFPEEMSLLSPYFIGLIIADAKLETIQSLERFSQWLLEVGLVGAYVWGPGGQVVETALDSVIVKNELNSNTPWSDSTHIRIDSGQGRSLEQAAWDARYVSWPSDSYFEGCRSLVAITVGHVIDGAKVEYLLGPNLQE